jgi:hypothetical protein
VWPDAEQQEGVGKQEFPVEENNKKPWVFIAKL